MNKDIFVKFINKYYLGGEIDKAKIVAEGNMITTKATNDSHNLLCSVILNDFTLDTGMYGIYNTSLLLKLINVLEDTVDINITKKENIPTGLNINDNISNVEYVLADTNVIPTSPTLKQLPPPNVYLKLNSDIVTKYNKCFNALSDIDNVTLLTKDNNIHIVFGYATTNSNRISFKVNGDITSDLKPISFNAKIFKEIITTNKDIIGDMEISDKGLASIKYKDTLFTADYFLIASNLNK